MKDAAIISAGFLAGALIGFFWAQGTKKAIANGVKTDFSDGVLTVEVDAQQAALFGFTNLLN